MLDTRKKFAKHMKQQMKHYEHIGYLSHSLEDTIAGKHYGWNGIDFEKPYIIVAGKLGIGKTVFIDGMKLHNHNMQYVEVQHVKMVDKLVLKYAYKIIEIREVNLNEQ